jgi:TorA maturation chaperone TorD
LYLAEPDGDTVRYLRGLPGFADILPEEGSQQAWLEDEAAEYQRLFGMNVYPYESMFTGRDLMLNGEGSERVGALYADARFYPGAYNVGAPDHIGIELALMSDLIAAERDAGSAGEPAQENRAQTLQARCLHDHLAAWVPVFALTVQRIARRPLHRLLAGLTIEMVLTDAERSNQKSEGLQPSTSNPSQTQGHALQPSPFNAPRDEQGINDVVRRLITPAEVGVFITRADIHRIASDLQLPVSLGDRFGMLRSLSTSAAQFDLLPPLLGGLGLLFSQAEHSLSQLAASYPAWSAYAKHWHQLISNGRILVSDLDGEVRRTTNDE